MKILVTGSDGFIAKNLISHLSSEGYNNVIPFNRKNNATELNEIVKDVDFVFHLAGANRPPNPNSFLKDNCDLTQSIVDALIYNKRDVPLVFSSSIQSKKNNRYGNSKRLAENIVLNYAEGASAPVYLYRFPNVFGKWCRPNYNSVVATFCHNIANDLPIIINNHNSELSLVYIDDVCSSLINLIGDTVGGGLRTVSPIYTAKVGEIAELIHKFKDSRENLVSEEVGTGLVRALYSTYLSYLKPKDFVYKVPAYCDARGAFVEVLKTKSSGQFSFFTARPGVMRGGHYHHSKNEKFLLLKGKAKYHFKNIITSELYEIIIDDTEYKIVETVPGWSHAIENIGNEEIIVMLWANEIFNKAQPDTIESSVT